MSVVAVIGSAEIDSGVIDTSKIGVVEILVTEKTAMLDSPVSSYKKGSKTFTEGLAAKDSFSKLKHSSKTFTEGLATKDIFSLIKKGYKTLTEGLAVKDSFTAIKTGYKTFTEGLAIADIRSLYKIGNKVFLEGLKLYDMTPSKFKSVTKQFLEFLGVSYLIQELIFKKNQNVSKYDNPAICIDGSKAAHIGKAHIGGFVHRIWALVVGDE